jgi:hypothetical protein
MLAKVSPWSIAQIARPTIGGIGVALVSQAATTRRETPNILPACSWVRPRRFRQSLKARASMVVIYIRRASARFSARILYEHRHAGNY